MAECLNLLVSSGKSINGSKDDVRIFTCRSGRSVSVVERHGGGRGSLVDGRRRRGGEAL